MLLSQLSVVQFFHVVFSPVLFFWPDLVDRRHNAHTDAQYKATEPRLLRAYQCKARLSPDSKKYMTSGRIGFLFSLGLDRLQLQENTQLA